MKQLLSDLRANGENAINAPYVAQNMNGGEMAKSNQRAFMEIANPKNILLILDAMYKMRVALEKIAKNKKVEEQEHWEWGNCDDSYSHGYDVGRGYCGEEARQTLKEVFGDE